MATPYHRLRTETPKQLPVGEVSIHNGQDVGQELSFGVTSVSDPGLLTPVLFGLFVSLTPALPCSAQLPPSVVSDFGAGTS